MLCYNAKCYGRLPRSDREPFVAWATGDSLSAPHLLVCWSLACDPFDCVTTAMVVSSDHSSLPDNVIHLDDNTAS